MWDTECEVASAPKFPFLSPKTPDVTYGISSAEPFSLQQAY